MNAEQVRELIEGELTGHSSLRNLHGCELPQCLVPPILREYDDVGGSHALDAPLPVVQLWLVLEEPSKAGAGYKIVYGEQARMFGLATPGTVRDVFIGYHGSFLDAFHAM